MRRRNYLLAFTLLASALLLAGCGGDEVAEVVLDASPKADMNESATAQAQSEGSGAVEPETAPADEIPDNMVAIADTSNESPVNEPDFSSVDGVIAEGEYAHTQRLGRTDVYWSNDAEHLWVALSAKATGYVSVGFDPVNRKVGANYIIGYVKDGVADIRDNVGTRGNLHDEDVNVGGTDDILASAGTEEDGVTILEFVIPLDSGDPYDRKLEPGKTYEIQTAHQLNRDDFISIHSYHGIGQFTLDPVD